MASGFGRYRNAIDESRSRRGAWEKAHPRESRLYGRIEMIHMRIGQFSYRIAWTDRICAKTGRGVNERYHECVRGLAHLARMKGAFELRLKEIAA